MESIYLLSVIFVLMLAIPIAFATLYYKSKQGEILHINQTRIRDARYFSKSFVAKVQEQLPKAVGNQIKLSKEETFWNSDIKQHDEETVEELVIGIEKDFHPKHNIKHFRQEIYCEKNIFIDTKNLKLRAAYAGEKAMIGNGIEVLRWIDAQNTLAIYDDCDLGMSASAGQRLSIGYNCHFRRLYARQICLGQYPEHIIEVTENRNTEIYRMPVQKNREHNMRYISKEMINDDGIVDFSIISWHNVSITEQIIVQGDVRSHKGVRLCDGAVVCGNIFAEGDVLLGRNTTVLGNVFSQGNIYLEERACVGQKGKISSVIARDHITFEKETFVFGYVSCERGGVVVPDNNQQEEEARKIKKYEYRYLETPVDMRELKFRDLYEYEHVDSEGFRREKELQKVTIPMGAVYVPESQFFGCEVLQEVKLPKTMKRIGDYAFGDCYALKRIEGFAGSYLEEIGTSAFENCKSLTEVIIQNTVRKIGGAAFAGCSEMKTLIFVKPSVVYEIGDHAFRGCKSLKEINLPHSVQRIGVSAFRDCDHLRILHIPERCKNEPGIAELKEINPKVEIRYRTEIELDGDKYRD